MKKINQQKKQITIKMKQNKIIQSSKNKQENTFTNIIGFLNSRSLFKKNKQQNQSTDKKNRATLNYEHLNDFIVQDVTQKNNFTNKNIHQTRPYDYSIKNKSKQIQSDYVIQTARTPDKNFRVSFKLDNQKQKDNMIEPMTERTHLKHPIKSRFYYNNEYSQNQEEQQKYTQSLTYRTQNKIYPKYIDRINRQIQQKSIKHQSSYYHKRRSISPLSQSRLRYFQKCRHEAYNYLSELKYQLKQSLGKIHLIKQKINEQINHTIKQRTQALREQLYDIVEQIAFSWEREQLQLIRQNQLIFIDDILQVEEQISHRQNKINQYIEQVIRGDSQDKIKNKIDLDWKKITADLLLFNYQDSILELTQLCNKLSLSINQKSTKIINQIPSSKLFLNTVLPQVLDFKFKKQLKDQIVQFLNNKHSSNKKQTINKNDKFQIPFIV